MVKSSASTCFNCTFMELKSGATTLTFYRRESFNCTFMELKFTSLLILRGSGLF